jgi:hypothetical protein
MMSETVKGFGIEETDEGFILRHDGGQIKMSKEEFFSLKTRIKLWTDRILSRFQARTGEVQPIVSHLIAQVGVWPDAIQENVLLTLTTAAGTTVTFSLPIPVAGVLAEALPRVLTQIPQGPMA